MKSLFKKVNDFLLSTYSKEPQGHCKTRINNLTGFVTGMIRKGSSHLSDIGSGLPKNIDANSKTMAAKRFIASKHTNYEVHYFPFLVTFLEGLISTFIQNSKEEVILVIDGSQMGKNNAALAVSLVWKKRGIPLCWLVREGGKGHFCEEDHITILQKAFGIILPLLPASMKVVVLGDGEFDGIDLQKLCLNKGADYALRTACNTILYREQEVFQGKNISPKPEHDCLFIENVEFTKKRFKYVNYLCWHNQKRHKDPIFLISNLGCPRAIMDYYDLRYSIECLFKDIKSKSFNIHKTRLKKAEQVNNLILIAALAFIIITSLAINYDKLKYRKMVQRVRTDQIVLSFFSFAYKLIQHFLDNQIDFHISCRFSKNE